MPSKLRIAEVAPLYARVPPVTYGGTERVVHWLTETLVELGHDVTLYATADAVTKAKLRAMRKEPLFDTWERDYFRPELAHASAVAEVLRDAAKFDVIHFQLGAFSIPFSTVARVPTVHSMGSPIFQDDEWTLRRYPKARVTARSRRQIEDLPRRRQRAIDVVYNGCDFDAFPEPRARGRYLAFLGRMGEIKNPVGAIRLAREVGMPLVLAGAPVEPQDDEYFETQVRPLIDSKRVKWIGPVDEAGKRKLLRDAAALLFPVQTEEAFGIVMIEAMACGVPVVACEYGAVAEVVDEGVTGYTSEEEEDLAAMIPQALELDRGRIRAHARRRFSRQVMTEGYLRVFQSAIDGFTPGSA